ncbi:MAG: DinB family protein, partial [Gemmatimonadaceae bacterium]|nr:DinB family protein [Gemmatimonadaceae bacterium]
MANAHSQITEIIAGLHAAEQRLIALAARTDAENWTIRDRPDSWSIAECVEHLNMTSRAFIPLIRSALENDQSRSDATRHSFKRDTAGFMLSAMVGPLRKIGQTRIGRVKTTAEFEPKDLIPKNASVADFSKLQTVLIHLIRGSERRPLSDIKIVSPFGGKL